MNFAELKLSLETLLGVEFRFKAAEPDPTFYSGDRWIAYSKDGDVILRDENSIRYKGCGDYHDNMTFPEGDLSSVYRWVVENVVMHNERKTKRVVALREGVAKLRTMGHLPVEYVEDFETINPAIRARFEGVELFKVVPRFRTAFVQFTEDNTFPEEEGEEINNGFDCTIHKIEDRIKPLPSGHHVFRFSQENEILFGMRAFMTPHIELVVREITVDRVPNQRVDTEHPFYQRLLRMETVKVVEYTVP